MANLLEVQVLWTLIRAVESESGSQGSVYTLESEKPCSSPMANILQSTWEHWFSSKGSFIRAQGQGQLSDFLDVRVPL